MKKIYLIISSITLALFLSACGGGSDASFSNSEVQIDIPTCEMYENIITGDTIIQKENNTSIKTVFDINGTKKVCTLNGSAYILRK